MHQSRRFRSLFPALLPVLSLAFSLAAHAQDDAPSLGDVARQARQQKQKDTQTKPAAADTATPNQNSPNQFAPNQFAPTKDMQPQTKDAQSQNQDGQGKDSTPATQKAPHVITNDEIPSHIGPTSTAPAHRATNTYYPQDDDADRSKAGAATWTSQIQNAKTHVESLKDQIAQISSSIQYAGGNCVSGCVQWNEQQKRKQDQVDAMKAQLDQEQQHLDEMQDQCGRQGYGSSVCDP